MYGYVTLDKNGGLKKILKAVDLQELQLNLQNISFFSICFEWV